MKNKQESSNTARNTQNKQSETSKTTNKGGCGCKKSSSAKNCG